MTERENMLSGLLYDPSDPELSRRRDVARNPGGGVQPDHGGGEGNKAEDFKAAFGLTGRVDGAVSQCPI